MNQSSIVQKKILALLVMVSFLLPSGNVFAQSTADNSSFVAECTANILAPIATTFATGVLGDLLGGTLVQKGKELVMGALGLGLSVPVNDSSANATLSAITGIEGGHAGFQDAAKMALDAAAYGVGQCALTMLTNNTVRWIKGGFQGSPNFAVDTTRLFQDISDGVLQDISNQIKNVKACDFTPNFINDLANSVELSAPKRNKFPARIHCPFPALNITASQFYGPASQFTWKKFETALGDGGNQFIVKVNTAEETAWRQAEAKATADQKLNWSNGFADIVDTSNCPSMPQEVILAIANNQLPPGAVASYQRSYCKTTTPGKIVGDQLGKSLGVDMDRLGFADNMNKILSALIGQLTKEAISGIFTAANNATPATGPSHNPSVMTSAPSGTGGTVTPILAPVIIVGTVPASAIGSTFATLNGSISSSGTPDTGTAWFEWGNTTALGNTSPSSSYVANTVASLGSYNQPLTGLSASTTYYFRATGKSANRGLTSGPILNFTTKP